MKRIVTLLYFMLSFSGLYADDSFNFSNLPTTGKEQAVLVLCPGLNMDGSFFLKENPWLDFAKENNLGIITTNFNSDPEKLYSDEKCGYYWPEQGSGKALLDEIQKVYGKELPILIYGFSGGAQFVSRFIDYAPNRILAWCAYSAQFWDDPKINGTKSRGIVACGELDGTRWQPSYIFFHQGRKQLKNWIWVSRKNTEHTRSGKLESFIRLFFKEEINNSKSTNKSGDDIYADLSTLEIITKDEADANPVLNCPFRTIELYDAWKEINSP